MKQLIAPIAIIVALIAFFVIIDRREFNRHDDVQTVQSESPMTNRKPTVSVPETKPDIEVKSVTETKPVETKPVAETKETEAKPVADSKPMTEVKSKPNMKPVEAKPVIETKPAEEKPVETKPVAEAKPVTEAKHITEAKPAETKPVETKPVETKPVAQSKPEENLLPAAVPVVTAEEAEKLNEEAKEFALAEKERREPFFRLYQDSNIETLCFEGTIRATSTIPDPTKNDYDNCLYALFIELDSLLTDTPGEKIPYEVIVNTPIMKEKIILQDNKFLPGDKVWCICAEYDAMPQNIQEIQLSDDIQSYEHQQYYSMTIHKITAFQKGGNRNFAKREITVLPLQILPKEEKAVIARKKRIQSEIQRIEEELKKHGGTFESWKEEYKPIIEKYNKLSSEEYKVWINDSYFACGKGSEPTYKTKEYIEGLQPYKQYLEDNNIDLIIVRIPTKWEFSRCVLVSDVFQDNPAWIQHYYECLKNDIEIVDPMPEMWEHRFDFPLFYFYNVQSESHPFAGQSFISAKVLSNVLKRYSYSVLDKTFELDNYTIKSEQPREFWPKGNENFNPEENISIKRVVYNGNSIGQPAVNTGSPFLFLSNSFYGYWYCRINGASVPAYTAYFLKHIPDWFYQDGIGNPMIRNLVSDPQALSNRKVVIMVGHPGFWNNSFPSFPKYIADKAKCISLEKSLDFQSSDITNLDNGSFLFKNEDNATSFTQNMEMDKPNRYFDIQMSIPNVVDKETCMLRINFRTNSYIKTIVSDKDTKDIIDQTTLSFGENLHSDFYIPVTDGTRQILIRFAPSYPNKQFSIKNIELWYY